MKRKIIIILSMFLIIGATLLWLGFDKYAPAVNAQVDDLTTLDGAEISAMRWEASAKYYASHPGTLPRERATLGSSDRYSLEMHNILPGREAPNRYGLEMYHITGDTDIAKFKTNEKIFHIQQIRNATRSYKWSEAVEDVGFVQLYDCIAHTEDPSIGAMGVHFILPERFDDQLVLEEPEVLVYEQKANGRMKLAAVEYIIPAAAWNEDAPPVFLGQELKYKTTMGKYGAADGIDPYYEVHVWAWKHNPSGFFADWNPKVSCPASE